MAKRYQIGKIRTLLMRGFTPGELRNLCYDEFRPVYDSLAENTGKGEIVSELLEYAERKGEFDRLLAWAQEQNPTQYAEYDPYAIEPTPTAPTPTLLPSPPPPVLTPLLYPLRVFLGHATHGNPAIVALYHWLGEAGVEAWLDEEDLLPGQVRQQEIVKQVRAADVVLVCLTHELIIASGEVHKTIRHVLDVTQERTAGTFLLIPLRLDPTSVPESLSEWQPVSLSDPRSYEKLLQALQRHAEAKAKAEEAERKTKPEMILIPAGNFLMGSDPKRDKDAIDNEQPQHSLYLPDYYMAKTPVTNVQYAAFVQATGHRAPNYDADWTKPYNWSGQTPPKGKENHPVVLVSWHDALAYCRWLGEATGKSYRLPSEAEWEKGARGTDSRIYPWGNQWDAKRCNSHEGRKGSTMPVGAYPDGASPYGLLDMAGNVWEWCSTIWQEKAYPFQVQDEWTKTYLDRTDVFRVLRGGAFDNGTDYVRCAVRYRNDSLDRFYYAGFRIVLPPK